MRSLNGVLAALALAAFGQAGFAATASGSFAVTASVSPTCNVATSDVAFGAYDPASATARDAEGAVRVTCTNTTTYNVGLDAGTGSGATVSNRKMTGGSETLDYALYSNSGRTTNWGNTVGTDTVSGTGNGSAQTLTVYGRIAASQYPAPASYSDTITATITY